MESTATQENNAGIGVVREVDQVLTRRFGSYVEKRWSPSESNTFLCSNGEFDQKVSALLETERSPEDARRGAASLDGFADTVSQNMYIRYEGFENQPHSLRQLIGHEEFHLWFLKRFQGVEQASGVPRPLPYMVNEAFVETLSLQALDSFSDKAQQVEEKIDTGVHNYYVLKVILDLIGKKGWRHLVQVCNGTPQKEIELAMQKQFGEKPPPKLIRLNDQIPSPHGRTFWGRFKDLAAYIELSTSDSPFQPGTAAEQLMPLVVGWSRTENAFTDHRNPLQAPV